MAQLSQGEFANIVLAPGDAYEIMTGGVASVVSLYGAPSGTTTLTNAAQSFGPYGVNAKLRLTATTGPATYTLARTAPVAYNTATGDVEDPQAISAIGAAGRTVLISGAVTITADSAPTYNGKTLEWTTAAVVTLSEGLPDSFGFAGIPPASGNASIAAADDVLINGAGATLTRAAAGNVMFAVVARASAADSYVVTGV